MTFLSIWAISENLLDKTKELFLVSTVGLDGLDSASVSILILWDSNFSFPIEL